MSWETLTPQCHYWSLPDLLQSLIISTLSSPPLCQDLPQCWCLAWSCSSSMNMRMHLFTNSFSPSRHLCFPGTFAGPTLSPLEQWLWHPLKVRLGISLLKLLIPALVGMVELLSPQSRLWVKEIEWSNEVSGRLHVGKCNMTQMDSGIIEARGKKWYDRKDWDWKVTCQVYKWITSSEWQQA